MYGPVDSATLSKTIRMEHMMRLVAVTFNFPLFFTVVIVKAGLRQYVVCYVSAVLIYHFPNKTASIFSVWRCAFGVGRR